MRNAGEGEMRRFDLKTADDLRAELARLGARLPLSEAFGVLGEPVEIAGRRLANRFVVQPMEGVDAADGGGTPGELTFRRYRRFAAGGSALIWFESAAVCRINESSVTSVAFRKHKALCQCQSK